MHSTVMTRAGRIAFGVATSALALAACGPKTDDSAPAASETTATTTTTTTTTSNAAAPAAAPAAAAAAAAPAPDNTDTISGVKYASYTGDAAKGEVAFATCKTCHSIEAGKNMIGPSLHNVVGRAAGTIAGFTYTPANKDSGITWTPDKLFQYLENPQRVVPGTKMTFAGFPDPQKRADVIAYLQAN